MGDPEKISRRKVLGYLGAAAVVGTMPPAPEAQAGSPKKSPEKIASQERLIGLKVERAQATLRSPDALKALKGEGPNAFQRALNAARCPIDPSELEGTKYDVSRLLARAVQIQHYGNRPNAVVPIRERGRLWKGGGYSGGIAWERGDTILTAAHVIDSLERRKPLAPKDGIDIGFIRVPKGQEVPSELIVHDNPDVTHERIRGAFVVAVGIDPDEKADPITGYKVWAGVAVDMSGISKDPTISKAFALQLPPGEAVPRRLRPEDPLEAPAAGASGFAVYAWLGEKWEFAGVFGGNDRCDVDKTCSDVGFFQGVDWVREKAKHAQIKEIY